MQIIGISNVRGPVPPHGIHVAPCVIETPAIVMLDQNTHDRKIIKSMFYIWVTSCCYSGISHHVILVRLQITRIKDIESQHICLLKTIKYYLLVKNLCSQFSIAVLYQMRIYGYYYGN